MRSPVTSTIQTPNISYENAEEQEPTDPDERILYNMGYKQELYRGFNALMSFSFCFTAVAVISSITGLFPTALSTGGPAMIVWSWIAGSICTIINAMCLAEICSTYPSAGSVYHWAGCCCSEKYAPLVSYITGWLNFVGNAAGDAFYGYTFAALVSSTIELNNGDALSTGATVGLGVAICFFWALLNLFRVDRQGWLNNFAMLWQIGTTIVIVVTLLSECTHGNLATSKQVFTTYYDGTGFDNVGYVSVIGLLSALYSFSGYEAAGHMAEETSGAYKSAPMGIVWTCVVTAIVGLAYWLGLLYATAYDVPDFVSNGTAVTDVFQLCTSQKTSVFMASILCINMIFSGMSSLTVTTRIAFAMARDGAFPGSATLRYVDPSTRSPLGTVVLVFVIDTLLILLNLINTTAFVNVTALSTIGYQLSYAVAILMRITFARTSFPLGPFNLGKFGVPLGWFSVIFLTGTSVCFFFPTTSPITTQNMNWVVVVFVGCWLIGAVHWIGFARHHFVGPRSHNKLLVTHSSR